MNRRRFTQQLATAAAGAMALGQDRRGQDKPTAPALRVDGERINRQLLELAQFGKNPYGGVSRVAYSDFDRQGREWAMKVMREAGLSVNIDAAGNIFGRRPGSVATLKPLVFGSHIDSVPDGGNYDGDVGSLSAIEVARTLAANNLVTRHPLEVVIFQNEEGGTVGSRALVGELTAEDLLLKTHSGKTIGGGITFLGGDSSTLASVKTDTRRRGRVRRAAHRAGRQPRSRENRHRGGRGHRRHRPVGSHRRRRRQPRRHHRDGRPPRQPARHGPLHRHGAPRDHSTPGRQVGTVGRVQAFPGAPNVIPGKAVFTLEIRDLDQQRWKR